MEEVEFQFGNSKFPIKIRLSEFKGKKLIDIRKHFVKEDEVLPTKKGISLNASQFSQLLNILSNEQITLTEHFEIAPEDLEYHIEFENTIGRSFSFQDMNDEKKLVLNNKFKDKLNNISPILFGNLILSFYKAIGDVIDEDDILESILDRFDHHIRRIEW